MKDYIFIVYFILSCSLAIAQKETTNWISATEGCAMMSDKNGNLLFYTNGELVWNSNNVEIPAVKFVTLMGDISSTQSSLILPFQCNDSLYHIFTTDNVEDDFVNGFRYSVLNMKLDTNRGDIVVGKKHLLIKDLVAEKLTAIPHANGVAYWVIVHEMYNNKFLSYLVNDNGVSLKPVISNVGTALIVKKAGQGYLKPSTDGKKLAMATSDMYFVEVFDFDNSTGKVSHPITLPDPEHRRCYGVSFSPDNTKLYVSAYRASLNPRSIIYQYDLSIGNSAASILPTKTTLDSNVFQHAAIQNRIDGKMYVAILGGSSLAVINNPNAAGMACNYQDNSSYIIPGIGGMGLPNFLESYFDPFPLPPPSPVVAGFNNKNIKFCQGDTVSFIDTSVNVPTEWTWYFGDPHSGKEDTSHLQNPIHVYKPWAGLNQSKEFNVTLISGNCLTSDTLIKIITVINTPPLIIHGDTSCARDTVILRASGALEGDQNYGWFALSNPSKLIVMDSVLKIKMDTTTSFIVMSPYVAYHSCKSIDTVKVVVKKLPLVNLGSAQYLCDGTSSVTLDANHPGSAFLWSTLETTQQITVKLAGDYSVRIIDDSKCHNEDTIAILEKCPPMLFVPNSFTPNNDGENDVFIAYTRFVSSIEMIIFNRWGTTIARWPIGRTGMVGWDGTYNGKPAQEDVYIWVIKYGDEENNMQTKSGTIALIR